MTRKIRPPRDGTPSQGGAGTPGSATGPTGYAVTFVPADPPRTGTVLYWSVDGQPLPDQLGRPARMVLVPPAGNRAVSLPVRQLTIAEAVPQLLAIGPAAVPASEPLNRPASGSPCGPTGGASHPSATFWAAATQHAVHLVARRLLLPGVSPDGYDAWRVGPLDPADTDRLRGLAAAMPPTARAWPVPGHPPVRLPDAVTLLRAFVDAVADTLTRLPAAGSVPWAALDPQPVPGLRDWADEVAAGTDAGVRLSLRLEPAAGADWPGPWVLVPQIHSRSDPALVVDAARLWSDPPTGFGPRARNAAVLALRRATDAWPVLAGLLDVAVPDRLTLDDGELGQLAGPAIESLTRAGVAVHWPAALSRELTAGVVLGGSRQPTAERSGLFSDLAGLSVNWRLALRGEPLSEAERDQLVHAHRPVVRLRDKWVLVNPALLDRARVPELAPLDAADGLRAALAGSTEIGGERVEVAVDGWLAEVHRRLTDLDGGSMPAPPGLAATLRGYQLRGLRWLVDLTSLGFGGCLADDMGLGKTVTLIALHLHRQADPTTAGPTLVVCPASLLGNWEREIHRFAPGTPVRRFHGTARCLDGGDGGIVLTTYATARLDLAALAECRWGLLVADEAQHLKNPAADTARAVRRIPAAARVALTGTPVENNLTDLWAILDWASPGLLGPLATFRAQWVRPVQVDRDAEAAHRLARLVRPFLLRRRKSDPGIAPELPAKTESDRPVALTVEQAALYEATVRESLDQIAGHDGMTRRGLVIRLLTGLKQICNHPAQYLKESDPRIAGRSGKVELLDELLDTILPSGSAVLVFTQYVTMGRLLERHLRQRGVPAELLHGGTPVARREDLVRRFQDGNIPVFLLSLKAAGTGLNLTRADHVVHFDRWWNPAVEDQATDRAYRIGQTRPVQVHRLVAEGTVEDRIAELLAGKRNLADTVLHASDGALTELSDAELADLVRLRGTR